MSCAGRLTIEGDGSVRLALGSEVVYPLDGRQRSSLQLLRVVEEDRIIIIVGVHASVSRRNWVNVGSYPFDTRDCLYKIIMFPFLDYSIYCCIGCDDNWRFLVGGPTYENAFSTLNP